MVILSSNLEGAPGLRKDSKEAEVKSPEPGNATTDKTGRMTPWKVNETIGKVTGMDPDRVVDMRVKNIEASNAALSAVGTATMQGLSSLKRKYDRWQASRANDATIRTTGEAINAAYGELAGVKLSAASATGAEAVRFRERQAELNGIIEARGAERKAAAAALAEYYGPRIENPMLEADGYEKSIQGLRAERLASQTGLEKARFQLDAVNRKISELDNAGKLTSEGLALMTQEMKNFSSQIDSHAAKIAMQNDEIGNVQGKLLNLRVKHGDMITLGKQLRSMQENGLNRTLAEPRPVQPEAPALTRPSTSEVVDLASRRTAGSERAAPVVGTPETATEQVDIEAIVRGFGPYLNGIREKLRGTLQGMEGGKELLEPMDTKNIIERWNKVAEGSDRKIQKILGLEESHLLKMLPSKTTLMDFGVMVRLLPGREPAEVEAGIMNVAQAIQAESAEKKKAA